MKIYNRLANHKTVLVNCVTFSTSRSPVIINKPQQVWRRHVFRTGLGLLAAGIAYDGSNEFQYCGGAGRFLRSLKIAAWISFDYGWNLYGVDEASEEYTKVSVVY